MNNKLEIEVARFDGFLYGISALDGKIRERCITSFLLDGISNEVELEELLVSRFQSNGILLSCSSIENMKGGLASLESEIKALIFEDLLGLGIETVNQKIVNDRKKYLAFRVMDFIQPIIGNSAYVNVLKIIGRFDSAKYSDLFYCIIGGPKSLIIHFYKNELLTPESSEPPPYSHSEEYEALNYYEKPNSTKGKH